MIDPALQVSRAAVWMYFLKLAVFMYITPVVLGFLVATLYPIGMRAASKQKSFLTVMLAGALAPSVMLLGWSLVARAAITAPLYGLGYGLGVALLSRVHRIQLWPRIRIETRRAAYERLAEAAKPADLTTRLY